MQQRLYFRHVTITGISNLNLLQRRRKSGLYKSHHSTENLNIFDNSPILYLIMQKSITASTLHPEGFVYIL